MLRSVLKPCELDDGSAVYRVEPGVLLATMLPLTNTLGPAGPDFDPDRWDGRRLRGADSSGPGAKESVTTFGHGAHRCPAQRFSLSAIDRAVERLFAAFELHPRFESVRAIPSQIGGVARAADPCPVDYVRRVTATVRPIL
jgi:cytochrome P450